MSPGPATTNLWEVSARGTGEVLAVTERAPGLVLTLISVPIGFSEAEISGWLHDVAAVALEAARGEQAPQTIPALLHHALTGLLFSHAEVWEHPDLPIPASVVFVCDADEIGFGWVGEAGVEVWLDDQPADLRYVVVRDPSGREARAWSVPRDRMVRIQLTWRANPADSSAPSAVLNAGWDGVTIEPGLSVDDMLASAPPRQMPPQWAPASIAAPAVPPSLIPSPEHSGSNAMAWDPSALWSDVAETIPPAESSHTPSDLESARTTADLESARAPADLDPARPSSGIARWLLRNFSWLAARQPAPASEQDQEHASAHAFATGSAMPMPDIAPNSGPPSFESVSGGPSGSLGIEDPAAYHAAMEPETSSEAMVGYGDESPRGQAPSQMSGVSFEDRLAADAAALAAALGGEPMTRETAPPRLISPGARTPGTFAAESDPPVEWRPLASLDSPSADAVFERLPGQIPPTPEPPTLAASAAPMPPPIPTLASPPAPPVEQPPPSTGPPRIEIAPRSFLRRPGEREPGVPAAHDPAEIHARALEARLAETSVAPAEPLRIERIGVDVTPDASADPNLPVSEAAPATDQVPPLPATLAPAASPAFIETLPEALLAEPSAEVAAEAPANEFMQPEFMQPEFDPRHAADPAAARARRLPPQRPAWPEMVEIESGRGGVDSRWGWAAALVIVLFAAGWLLGSVQWGPARPGERPRGVVPAMMQSLGFHGPTFTLNAASRPDGAHILVDGDDTGQRTPAVVQLAPGKHTIALSFGQWGKLDYPINGKRGDKLSVDGTMWASLEVVSPEANAVIAVAVDGRPRGFAPLRVDSLAPGPHQVRFSGPGMASWGQTVEVNANEAKQVLTRPLSSPSTGVLLVRVTATQDGEAVSLKGARVYIDADLRGVTPLTVELPRGPHSVRAVYGSEEPPVQVIDLPGGNQRFATFDVGGTEERPRLRVDAPARFSTSGGAVVSATLGDVSSAELREMWLHVRGADGTWNRYAMTRLPARVAAVSAVEFPVAQFDNRGKAQWYVSAVTAQGDEYFTEMQTAALQK